MSRQVLGKKKFVAALFAAILTAVFFVGNCDDANLGSEKVLETRTRLLFDSIQRRDCATVRSLFIREGVHLVGPKFDDIVTGHEAAERSCNREEEILSLSYDVATTAAADGWGSVRIPVEEMIVYGENETLLRKSNYFVDFQYIETEWLITAISIETIE